MARVPLRKAAISSGKISIDFWKFGSSYSFCVYYNRISGNSNATTYHSEVDNSGSPSNGQSDRFDFSYPDT